MFKTCLMDRSSNSFFIFMDITRFSIIIAPGANFINKVRTIYLKLCVRWFLRSAYVSFIKTS